jgi:Ethanolamine utilization protein EutJ (predicted chaperonin)
MEGGHVSTLRLAIDLGTSHTVAVVRRGDEAPRPLLFDGSPVLPSAIFADPPRLHIGRDAERMALIDPSRFEPHPKRRVDEGSVLLGNTEVSVVDMFVALLRRVAEEAAQAGVPVGGGAVLTCPADWGASRRNVLMNAANAAGLGAIQLVDEPVAAATYCLDVLHQQVPVGGTVAVFDFGGGTLDASVLRREPTGLRVLSVGGLDDLGGIDVDAALVGHLGQLIALRSPRVWQRITNPGPQSEQRERRQFWDDVRAAKEMLSRTSSAPVHVPGMDSSLHLTRDELERVAGPLIDRAVDETRRVLRASGVDPADLAGLFLVGGSSRIPLVGSRLHARFGLAPTVPEQPELPVAYGGLIASGNRPTGQAAGRVAAPPQSRAPQPQAGHAQQAPPSAPQSGPPGVPQSVPPHSTQSVSGGFPISAPPGSYAPGSGGPVPGSPISGGGASYPPFPAQPRPFQGPQGAQGPSGPPHGPSGPPGRPPHLSPSMVPHPPPRRRRGGLRYVILAIVVGLVAICGTTGFWAFTSLRDAFDNAGADTGRTDSNAAEAGDLKQVGVVSVPGGGAIGTMADADGVFYAGVNEGKLQVASLGADGVERWSRTYPVEPTSVRLQRTGKLLVIEAEQAATHQGADVRLVIDAATGEQMKLDAIGKQRTVAYVGGDALVESVTADSKQANLDRIDLATGASKWKATIVAGSYVGSIDYRAQPMQVYAPEGPSTQQGVAAPVSTSIDPGTSADWHQALAADPATTVTLDAYTGKGTVFDANGKPKAAGDLPLDGQHWAAYEGVIVGRLSDKASPGRVTLVGYGADNFQRRWEVPLAAGASVERIKPCGPKAICVQYRLDSKYTVVAFDVTTNKEAWPGSMGSDRRLDWYLLSSGLVVGQWQAGTLGEPALHDPATSQRIRNLDGGVRSAVAMAASSRWVLVRGIKTGGTGGSSWTMTAVDIATNKSSTSLEIGPLTDQVVNASIRNDLVTVVGKNRRVVIGRTPGG